MDLTRLLGSSIGGGVGITAFLMMWSAVARLSGLVIAVGAFSGAMLGMSIFFVLHASRELREGRATNANRSLHEKFAIFYAAFATACLLLAALAPFLVVILVGKSAEAMVAPAADTGGVVDATPAPIDAWRRLTGLAGFATSLLGSALLSVRKSRRAHRPA